MTTAIDPTWRKFLGDLEAVRAAPPAPGVALRAEGDDRPTMTGHFSVFNVWYEIDSWLEGRFLERIAPGSFTKTFAESRESIKVTFNHGYDVLGDQVLGPIEVLREDEIGAFYEVPLFRGVPDLIVDGLAEGVYGASFRFRVIKDEWNDEPGVSDHNPQGLPERTIKEIRVFEFGPVTFPASPAATAGLRSVTDEYYDKARAHKPDAVEQLLARAREIRTPDQGAAPDPQQQSEPTLQQRLQNRRRERLAGRPWFEGAPNEHQGDAQAS